MYRAKHFLVHEYGYQAREESFSYMSLAPHAPSAMKSCKELINGHQVGISALHKRCRRMHRSHIKAILAAQRREPAWPAKTARPESLDRFTCVRFRPRERAPAGVTTQALSNRPPPPAAFGQLRAHDSRIAVRLWRRSHAMATLIANEVRGCDV